MVSFRYAGMLGKKGFSKISKNSDNLHVADAMVSNPRRVTSNQSEQSMVLDGSMSIYYEINGNGDGPISITTLRSNLINGGWIIIAALFDSNINMKFII